MREGYVGRHIFKCYSFGRSRGIAAKQADHLWPSRNRKARTSGKQALISCWESCAISRSCGGCAGTMFLSHTFERIVAMAFNMPSSCLYGCPPFGGKRRTSNTSESGRFVEIGYARARQFAYRPWNIGSDGISRSHRTGSRVALQKVQRGVLDRNRISNDCRSGGSQSGELRFDGQCLRGRTLDATCNAKYLRRPEYDHSKLSRHTNRRL
jgi:hypothetical protein